MTTRIAWKPAMFNPSLKHLLRGVSKPSLVVWSTDDKIVPNLVPKPIEMPSSAPDMLRFLAVTWWSTKHPTPWPIWLKISWVKVRRNADFLLYGTAILRGRIRGCMGIAPVRPSRASPGDNTLLHSNRFFDPVIAARLFAERIRNTKLPKRLVSMA